MAVEQLKNLIGAIRKDPAHAPDGQYDQVTEGKTSVVADMYNLDFKDKKALAEVSWTVSHALLQWLAFELDFEVCSNPTYV